MRLGKGGGAAAALLRNQFTFWSSRPSRRHFEHNSDRPLLHAFFPRCVMVDGLVKSHRCHPEPVEG